METLTIVNGDIYTPKHYGRRKYRHSKRHNFNDNIRGTATLRRDYRCLPDASSFPGLIDGLVHGGGGYDSMTGQVEDVATIARAQCAQRSHLVSVRYLLREHGTNQQCLNRDCTRR